MKRRALCGMTLMAGAAESPSIGRLIAAPGRTRTSTVNPSSIKVLARWDFLSYPECYPCQWRAGGGTVDIGWAPMSRFVKGARGTMTHEMRTVARLTTAF